MVQYWFCIHDVCPRCMWQSTRLRTIHIWILHVSHYLTVFFTTRYNYWLTFLIFHFWHHIIYNHKNISLCKLNDRMNRKQKQVDKVKQKINTRIIEKQNKTQMMSIQCIALFSHTEFKKMQNWTELQINIQYPVLNDRKCQHGKALYMMSD